MRIEILGENIKRKELDLSHYVKRTALDSDYDQLIKDNFILKDKDGKIIIAYLIIKNLPSQKMLNVIKGIDYPKDRRTTGLRIQSRVFGYTPRDQKRQDYCSSSALAYQNPSGHKIICDFASTLSNLYKETCPEMFTMHDNLVHSKIKNEWIIENSPFTSGVINKNSALKYHFDGGNVKNVFSNMVCFRRDCTGGHLAIPEYNIGLEIADKSVLFFDGQSIVHGVTPFQIRSIHGYRFTLVYYSLQQMWHCNPIDEELVRIKNRKTERETLRYKRLANIPLTEEEKERSLGLESMILKGHAKRKGFRPK